MLKTLAYAILLSLNLFSCAIESKHGETLLSEHEIKPQYMAGKKMVMISHPDCGFSSQAFRDFPPEIEEYFKKNGIFVSPISENRVKSEIKAVHEWNENSPFHHLPVLRTTPLPPLDLSSTPQFYFFQDGIFVEKVVGWPKDGSNLVLLKAAIERLQQR